MTDTKTVFSIAIPVRNGAEFLREALESALAQTYPPLEIVISDNASTDGTREICAEYAGKNPRLHFSTSSSSLSLSDNWNRAYRMARGEWVKILAHDDMLHPNCLERIAEEIAKLPKFWLDRLALVGTGEEWLFEGGRRRLNVIPHDSLGALRLEAPGFINLHMRGATPVPLPAATTATLHKTVIPLAAPYDGRFYRSDTVLYTNLVCKYHYLYLPAPLCVNRIQKASVTQNALRGQRSVEEQIQFAREFLGSAGEELRMDAYARFRFRLKPASAAASQISAGILCRAPKSAWGALLATPTWQMPLLPALTVRALLRDRRKLKRLALPAMIAL